MRLILRPSRVLAGGIAGAHAVAAGCALLVWPAHPGVLLGILLVVLGAVVAWRMALLGAPTSPRLLEVAADGSLAVELRNGARVEVSASAPRHVTRVWVILRTLDPSCRTVLVTADMLEPAEFRRLRIRAWWGWGRGAGTAQYLA